MNINILRKKLIEFFVREEWCVAIRPIGNKLLYEEEGENEPFIVIPNNFRYWCADPFIITVGTEDYLFFEMFDRFKGKGVIGYRKIDKNGKIGKMHKVYESEHHLSFPFVFEYKGNYYMMPESSYDRNLTLLRATQFPNRWEIVRTWFTGEKVCDSALLEEDGNIFLLTQPVETPYTHAKLDLYFMQNGEWVPCCINPVVNDSSHARMAGGIIRSANSMIRPSQDCLTYGDAICFSRIKNLSDSTYEEEIMNRVHCEDIKIQGKTNKYKGIHTYNMCQRFEVIDLKTRMTMKLAYIFSLFRK